MSLSSSSSFQIFDKSQCHPQSVSFSPDGEWLALGTGLGDIMIYSTTPGIPPQYHLSVENDIYNAIGVTCIEWKKFPWLKRAHVDQGTPDDVGIVAAFEDGHVRVVKFFALS